MGSKNVSIAMTMASADLVKSTKMNEDYQFPHGLQDQLKTLSTVVNDKSIADLRQEKREKRKSSPEKENAHLPVNNELALITPQAGGEVLQQ